MYNSFFIITNFNSFFTWGFKVGPSQFFENLKFGWGDSISHYWPYLEYVSAVKQHQIANSVADHIKIKNLIHNRTITKCFCLSTKLFLLSYYYSSGTILFFNSLFIIETYTFTKFIPQITLEIQKHDTDFFVAFHYCFVSLILL